MRYEIAAPVVAELHHHAHGAVRISLDAGVTDVDDPASIAVVEQLLVPAGVAVPLPSDPPAIPARPRSRAAARASQTTPQE